MSGFYLGFVVWGRSPEWPNATSFLAGSGGMSPRKFIEMNMQLRFSLVHFETQLFCEMLQWYFISFLSRDHVSCHIMSLDILGDPGADSGDEEKSKRAEKYMARRKVKNGEKSPWGQCVTRPVPNGRRCSGF